MAKRSKSKQPIPAKPKTNEKPTKLNEIDIQVNQLGQIQRNFDIDKINEFLNANVPDKKFSEEEE